MKKISKLLIAFSLVTTLSYASASTGFMNDNSHEAFAKSKRKNIKEMVTNIIASQSETVNFVQLHN
ncbi:hypothetical protein AAHH64_12160 [Staphylococcus epidermidis]